MPLYEKFGLDKKLFTESNFEFSKEQIYEGLHATPEKRNQYESGKHDLVFFSSKIGLDYYLASRKDKIEQYVCKIFDYAMEYFFGDWRKSCDIDGKVGEEYVKRSKLWVDNFRGTILWASVFGCWDEASKIAGYPDELCMEADFESKERKAWYVVLACYLRDGSLDNAGQFIDIIEQGRRKREKLLLNVLRAIMTTDSEAFDKEFGVYMKHYKAREYSQNKISIKLAIDGTIMFNLARHKGLQVEFPEKYMDHYIYL